MTARNLRLFLTRAGMVLGSVMLLGAVVVLLPRWLGLQLSQAPTLYPPADADVRDSVGVVLQHGRTDCGVAALVMVMTSLGARETYDGLAARLYADAQRPTDLSFADLAAAARADSISLSGFRAASLASLPERPPWIARLGHGSGGHFVVIDSVARERVFVRDPAVGRIEFPLASFERLWSGYALAVTARPASSHRPHPS